MSEKVQEFKKCIPLGSTDYYGKNARLRDYVLKNIEKIYQRYGFEPLYTPIVENAEVFNGHHGEGEKLLFKLTDHDKKEYVLKYDSTVPLARVVSMYGDIPLPYKRFQLQQSFRDDEVDKGHYREFIQCDGDIVGSKSLTSDAEIVEIAYYGLSQLGFENFTIRINHRQIIKAIANKAHIYDKNGLLDIQRAIDYADKVIKNGVSGIESDLKRRNINSNVIKIILDLINISKESTDINRILDSINHYFNGDTECNNGICELREIVSYLPNEVKEKCSIDFTLARGADYYTGFILEAVLNDIKLGAVLGGGRYDNLVAAFGDKQIPAVGMAFGMERILVALKELGLDNKVVSNNSIVIYASDKDAKKAIEIVKELRKDYNVNLIFSSDIKRNQIIEYCDKVGASLLGILDEDSNIHIERISADETYYHNVKEKLKIKSVFNGVNA